MKYRRRLPTHGQSLVEFALVAPLLFAFMLILVELGIIFSVYIGLTNSAREGARTGSVYQYENPAWLKIKATSTSCGTATGSCTFDDARAIVDTQRNQAIIAAVIGTANPIIDQTLLPNPTITYSPDPPSDIYRYGDEVTVTASYPHQLFFNLLGPTAITLRASSTMRIEPGGR